MQYDDLSGGLFTGAPFFVVRKAVSARAEYEEKLGIAAERMKIKPYKENQDI